MEAANYDKRVDYRKPVDVYMNKFIGEEPYMVRSSDISMNGIYVTKLIEPEVDEGSMVSLEFKLPNSDEVIWARGTVMREGRRWGADGVGVWFTILPDTYKKVIEEYLFAN